MAAMSSNEPADPPADKSTDDEMRRRYLEALERKRSGGPGGNNPHGPSRSSAPTSNDKRQRTFRRKSG